jgi:Histidine kinase
MSASGRPLGVLAALWPTSASDAAPTGEASGAARLTTPYVTLLTIYWVYITLSDVLYANSMQASLAILGGGTQLFAPWTSRIVQHVLLYPALLAGGALSLRIGWRPFRRALPLQAICGVVFATLATPALVLGEALSGDPLWDHYTKTVLEKPFSEFMAGPGISIWVAGATSFLLTYGFGLALLHGFSLYRRYKDAQLRAAALESSLSAAQLAALRMQLSPHTLFNLLHTMRGLIGWDPPAAQSMVIELADLLRKVLKAGERDLSRLADELEFARLYLALQQRRFSDRLRISVPESTTAPAVWVPSLILQVLLENAVVHGLAGHDSEVSIRITVDVIGDRLSICVFNSVAPRYQAGEPGIGLRNVRERLAIQFGDQASFSAEPGGNNEWIARLEIPALRDRP